MEKHDVFSPPLGGHLADGLQERLGFDIAYRTTDLYNGYIGFRTLQGINTPLDLVGNMGDDLDRSTQIVPFPLPIQYVPVYPAR